MNPALSAHERSAAALRLLFLGELSILLLRLLRIPAESYMQAVHSLGSSRAFSSSYAVVSVLPEGLIALGLLRFGASLENGPVRRWARAAAILLGVRMATTLGSIALSWTTQGYSGTTGPILFVAGNLVFLACLVTMLATVWKGSLLLAARPPRELFLAILVLDALVLVGRLASLFLLGDMRSPTLLDALHGPSYALVALLVGALFLTRAELLRTREEQPEESEWKAAAKGLRLWLWGLGALVGGGLLAAALMMTRSSLLSWSPGVTLVVALSGPLALMVMGLFQYARVPETTGARSSAYVAISLIVLAMASFMWAEQPILAIALRVISLTGMAFLIRSFIRAVPSHANTTRHVGTVLLISSAVTLALAFLGVSSGPLRLLYFVAALVNLVYAVRFIALVNRLRRELGADTAVPTAPMFSQT
jgi:hypothetical protein